jgi:hypothetical protein
MVPIAHFWIKSGEDPSVPMPEETHSSLHGCHGTWQKLSNGLRITARRFGIT